MNRVLDEEGARPALAIATSMSDWIVLVLELCGSSAAAVDSLPFSLLTRWVCHLERGTFQGRPTCRPPGESAACFRSHVASGGGRLRGCPTVRRSDDIVAELVANLSQNRICVLLSNSFSRALEIIYYSSAPRVNSANTARYSNTAGSCPRN
jgi:hypothetical protein